MGEFERRRRRLRPPADPVTDPLADPVADPVAATAPILDPSPDSPAPADSPTPADSPAPADNTAPATTPAATTPAAIGGPAAGRRPVPRPTSGAGAGGRGSVGVPQGGDDRETERGLRGLVGSGSSQVSVGAALRARDATRPTAAHLAEAEERLVIVRRNWSPREDLPRR